MISFLWGGITIHEYAASIGDGDDNDVRRTSREGLFFSDWQMEFSKYTDNVPDFCAIISLTLYTFFLFLGSQG